MTNFLPFHFRYDGVVTTTAFTTEQHWTEIALRPIVCRQKLFLEDVEVVWSERRPLGTQVLSESFKYILVPIIYK